MAIYHLSTKPVSRAAGRSATAAAAYRAGARITDERTGEIHDYTRKQGVEHSFIVAPFGVKSAYDREKLWNAAEAAEKRKDSRVAREFEIALPDELPEHERRRLAVEFARELVDRYGVAADVAIHAPSRDGDERNHHAHILCTTRKVTQGENGELLLGDKTVFELSDKKRESLGLGSSADELIEIREMWAQIANRSMGHYTDQRIDHRSLKDQGITDRLPQVHLGPAVTQMHRRGVKSDKWLSWEQANEALQAAAEGRRMGREAKEVDGAIIDTETDLSDLLLERKQIEHGVARSSMAVRQLLPARISERLDVLLDSTYYEDGSVVLLYQDSVRDELGKAMSRMDVFDRGSLRDALIERDSEASKLLTWQDGWEHASVIMAPSHEWRDAYEAAREVYMERTAKENLSLAPSPTTPVASPTAPEQDRKPIIQTTPHRARPRDNGLER